MPGMGFGFGFGFHRRGSGSSASASQQLLTLATDDGWHALYDPTSPDTRTLRNDGGDDYLSAIADGLGNLPDLTQGTAADQPQLVTGGFGQLDAGLFNGSSTSMETAAFSAALSQPIEILVIHRLDDATTTGRAIYDSSTGDRNAIFYAGSFDRLDGYGGKVFTLFSDRVADTDYITTTLFNGASSQAIRNGVSSGTFDAGTQGLASLRWGSNVSNSNFFSGRLGLILIYDGDPGSAKRNRMLDLVHDLTGIAKA